MDDFDAAIAAAAPPPEEQQAQQQQQQAQQAQQEQQQQQPAPAENGTHTAPQPEEQQQQQQQQTSAPAQRGDGQRQMRPPSEASELASSEEYSEEMQRRHENAKRGYDEHGRWRVRFFAEAEEQWVDQFTGYVDIKPPHLIITSEDDRALAISVGRAPGRRQRCRTDMCFVLRSPSRDPFLHDSGGDSRRKPALLQRTGARRGTAGQCCSERTSTCG